MSKRQAAPPDAKNPIRCAIYTRKSTEEGLELAFNSLDAQRESAEAYISAQRHEGWRCNGERYDDGGFSGGNIERPALKRLLADIEAGKVDCVVVYKVDRLSRSLMDFARIMQVFDARKTSFVSVTQQFNTTHSMGRLTLNILLSFAQFEREIISERTRDKMAAARRKGKWSGGKPLLGYDILPGPTGSKLIVNEDEALQVKRIFELYLQHQALIPTVTAVTAHGWCNKRWTTKRGDSKGGRPFDKTSLYKLLTNRTYTGVVTYQGTVYPGEHPAIVETKLFDRVQAVLSRNGHGNGATVKNRYGALLRGLLHCACCKCSMIHTYSMKKTSSKRYRYYVCLAAQKKGWHTCPSKSVPAGEIEAFVVDQIKKVGQDPVVLTKTLRSMQQQNERSVAELEAQQKVTQRALARHHSAIRKLMAAPDAGQLALLNDQVQETEEKLRQIGQQIATLQAEAVDPDQVRSAMSSFTPVWEQLSPKEQERVVRLLVERVAYDGAAGTIAVTFRLGGIKALAGENSLEVAA